MKKRVIIALLDGTRPDGIAACGHPFFERLQQESTCCLDARTVDPPITLPVHISLFSGVMPQTHGVLKNRRTAYPEEHPGLLQLVRQAGKQAAVMVGWEQLCSVGRPEDIARLDYTNGNALRHASFETVYGAQRKWMERAAGLIRSGEYDLIFIHYEMIDAVGHAAGWMSKPYIQSIYLAGECMRLLYDALQPGDQFILMADHGGHGDDHFDPNDPADMTVPIYCRGNLFEQGKQEHGWSVLDIAPTICAILDLEPQPQHTGQPRI